MINLIKANIYRLFNAKVTFVILILAVLFYLMSFGVMRLVYNAYEPGQDEVVMNEAEEEGDTSVTFTYSDEYEHEEVNSYKMMVDMMGTGIITMMVGVFAAIFTDEERKSGFLKNIPKPSCGKASVFLSKSVVMLLYSILMVLALLITAGVLAVVYHIGFIYDAGQFAIFLCKQVILLTAFGTAMLAFYEIFRKGILVIIIALLSLTIVNCVQIVETVMVMKNIVSERFIDLFGYSQYMIMTRTSEMTVGSDNAAHVSTWVVGLVSIVIYGIIGSLIYRKRDVL